MEKIKVEDIEKVYKKHKWIRYQELEPFHYQITEGIFMLIRFTFLDDNIQEFPLTEKVYIKWRDILKELTISS